MTIVDKIDPELRWIVTHHFDSYEKGEINKEQLLHYINSEYMRLFEERLTFMKEQYRQTYEKTSKKMEFKG